MAKVEQSVASGGELTRLRHWMALHKNANEMGILHDPWNWWGMTHEWNIAYLGPVYVLGLC